MTDQPTVSPFLHVTATAEVIRGEHSILRDQPTEAEQANESKEQDK